MAPEAGAHGGGDFGQKEEVHIGESSGRGVGQTGWGQIRKCFKWCAREFVLYPVNMGRDPRILE